MSTDESAAPSRAARPPAMTKIIHAIAALARPQLIQTPTHCAPLNHCPSARKRPCAGWYFDAYVGSERTWKVSKLGQSSCLGLASLPDENVSPASTYENSSCARGRGGPYAATIPAAATTVRTNARMGAFQAL